jgi:hypothetical protein
MQDAAGIQPKPGTCVSDLAYPPDNGRDRCLHAPSLLSSVAARVGLGSGPSGDGTSEGQP